MKNCGPLFKINYIFALKKLCFLWTCFMCRSVYFLVNWLNIVTSLWQYSPQEHQSCWYLQNSCKKVISVWKQITLCLLFLISSYTVIVVYVHISHNLEWAVYVMGCWLTGFVCLVHELSVKFCFILIINLDEQLLKAR